MRSRSNPTARRPFSTAQGTPLRSTCHFYQGTAFRATLSDAHVSWGEHLYQPLTTAWYCRIRSIRYSNCQTASARAITQSSCWPEGAFIPTFPISVKSYS